MAALEFRIETMADRTTRGVKVAGELDSATCDKLAEAVEQAIADLRVEQLVLDMREISFIDSAGLRTMLLIEQSAAQRGLALTVHPPPEEMMELLQLTGVGARLDFSRNAPAAVTGADFIERLELELPRDPHSPSRARIELRDSMGDRLERSELDAATLATSELVTNAVIHPQHAGGASILLRVALYEDRIRVEVADPGEGFDPATPVRPSGSGGRGLLVVDRCATRWGASHVSTEYGRRFCVWFELDTEKLAARAVAAR